MQKYVCGPCGYVYDPEVGDPDNGIAPGTAFEDLPEDWVCPLCGLGKDVFENLIDFRKKEWCRRLQSRQKAVPFFFFHYGQRRRRFSSYVRNYRSNGR